MRINFLTKTSKLKPVILLKKLYLFCHTQHNFLNWYLFYQQSHPNILKVSFWRSMLSYKITQFYILETMVSMIWHSWGFLTKVVQKSLIIFMLEMIRHEHIILQLSRFRNCSNLLASKLYNVNISIELLKTKKWKNLCTECGFRLSFKNELKIKLNIW